MVPSRMRICRASRTGLDWFSVTTVAFSSRIDIDVYLTKRDSRVKALQRHVRLGFSFTSLPVKYKKAFFLQSRKLSVKNDFHGICSSSDLLVVIQPSCQ